jgi:hypothetical protein
VNCWISVRDDPQLSVANAWCHRPETDRGGRPTDALPVLWSWNWNIRELADTPARRHRLGTRVAPRQTPSPHPRDSTEMRRTLHLGHFPVMTMHSLSRTVPSPPITRRNRSKAIVGPALRSNSTAPAPPAEVVSVATVTKSVLVQLPSAGWSTARVNGEGGVRGGMVNVDLDLGIEGSLAGICRGNGDPARPLPGHGRQRALRARWIGLRHGGCSHRRVGHEEGEG